MSRKAEVEAAIADVDFENNNYQVHLDTSHGLIVLDMNPEAAPEHCKNIMGLAKIGFYDGLIFHRVIPNFMIQGGGFGPGLEQKSTREPVRNEAANGLRNSRGTLAMARTNDPQSATAQFFINVVDNAFLDPSFQSFGYTVFGKVTGNSMDVVNAIRQGDKMIKVTVEES